MFVRFFLITQAVICILSLAIPSLPGWKMFASVKPRTLTLEDESGQLIDPVTLTSYPPYGLDDEDVKRIAQFRCRRDQRLTKAGSTTFAPPGCQP